MLDRVVGLALSAVIVGCSPGSPAVGATTDAGSHLPADASLDDAAPDAPVPEASDAAEDVYGSGWDAGNMLSDPAIWTPVPDDGGCGLYVAKVVPDPFPKRQWSSCGTGCEVSQAQITGLGFGDNIGNNGVYWGGTTASERAGKLYLRATFERPDVILTRVFRLGDGATVAAVEERNVKCGVLGTAKDMAFVFPIAGLHSRYRGGTVSGTESGASIVWGRWLGWDGIGGGAFAWDEGWGEGVNGALYVNTSPDQTAFQIVHSGNDLEVYGRGKLVVWYASDGGRQNAIESYTVSGGIKTLVKLSQGVVWSVALSDSTMAWIVVDGMDWANYRFNTAKLYWSPVATDPADVKVSGPVTIPIGTNAGLLTELRVGGDYAASHGCWQTGPTTGECRIFVVQLSTGKVWAIPPRPGSGYWDVMAVSQDTILAGETNQPHQSPLDNQYVRRFVRFSTAELDALQKGW